MSDNFNGSQSPLEFKFALTSIAQSEEQSFYQSLISNSQMSSTQQQFQENPIGNLDFGFLNPFSCESEDIGFLNGTISRGNSPDNFGKILEGVAEVGIEGLKRSNKFENDFDLSKFILDSSSPSSSLLDQQTSSSFDISSRTTGSNNWNSEISPTGGNTNLHPFLTDLSPAAYSVCDKSNGLSPSPIFSNSSLGAGLNDPIETSLSNSSNHQFNEFLNTLGLNYNNSQGGNDNCLAQPTQSSISFQSLNFDGGGDSNLTFAGGGGSQQFDFGLPHLGNLTGNGSSCHSSEPSTPEDRLLQTPGNLDFRLTFGGPNELGGDLIEQLMLRRQREYEAEKEKEQLNLILLGLTSSSNVNGGLPPIKEEWFSRFPSPITPPLPSPSPRERGFQQQRFFSALDSFESDFKKSGINSVPSIEDFDLQSAIEAVTTSSDQIIPSSPTTFKVGEEGKEDLHGPTKVRQYQVKSSTSKKSLPGFAIPFLIQEFQKAKETGNEVAIKELSALLNSPVSKGSESSSQSKPKSKSKEDLILPEGTASALERLESEIEKKRRNNTLSARKSRAKKVELEKTLEKRKEELKKEIESFKKRVRLAERELEWKKRR